MKPTTLPKQSTPLILPNQKMLVLEETFSKKETKMLMVNAVFFVLGILLMFKMLHG